MPRQTGNNKTASFVDQIVKDPNNPPDALLLQGYLGASSEEDHIRLYLDPQLSDYVEIPQDAVLHSVELPPEQSPLGGSYVWINRDADVTHGKAGGDRPKAKFLEGRIQQQYQAGAGGAQAGAPVSAQPCSGIQTQCCPISHPPCSGVQTQCCPVQVSHQPCSGIQTQCCLGAAAGGQAIVSAPPCSGVYTQCCPPTAQQPCSGIRTACCPPTAQIPCSGIHTACCLGAGPISQQPCSGIHTQCCIITQPPCSGVYTQCCPPTAQQPCSGIHTACCY